MNINQKLYYVHLVGREVIPPNSVNSQDPRTHLRWNVHIKKIHQIIKHVCVRYTRSPYSLCVNNNFSRKHLLLSGLRF